jgi:hypothetical protein
MGGVEEEATRPGAAATSLLRAVLQFAEGHGGVDPAVLVTAAQLLSRPGVAIDASLCTSVLQLANRSAGSAGPDALAVAEAAFIKAVASNLLPTQQAAAACISLATHDAMATQWPEIMNDSMSRAAPAVAAAWYKALFEQGIQVNTAAHDGTAVGLYPTLRVLLTAVGSQQVKLDAATLAGLVTVGLSAAGGAGAELAVQAAQAAQHQGQFFKVVNQLSPAQKASLSSALIGVQEWSLALATSRDADTLSQVLAAAADQQLPADALAAALDAAVSVQRPDLTMAFLQSHVLASPDMKGSTLLAALGSQAGLVNLCKHLLSSKPHLPATGEELRQQEHAQKVAVQLMQGIAAGGDVSLTDSTWRGVLDVMVGAAAVQQPGVPAQEAVQAVLTLCRVASAKTEGPAATWHLYAAAQLAVTPHSVPLAGACLQVGCGWCAALIPCMAQARHVQPERHALDSNCSELPTHAPCVPSLLFWIHSEGSSMPVSSNHPQIISPGILILMFSFATFVIGPSISGAGVTRF